MVVKDKIILLRRVKYSESDLVLKGLSISGGIVNLLAKSALKSRKRFGGGVLEPLNYIQATYKDRGNDQDSLHLLQEADLVYGFSALRTDYDRLELGFYFLQMMSKIVQENQHQDPALFNLLGNALRALEKTKDLPLLKLHFEIKLMNHEGVLPPDFPYIQDLLSISIEEHEGIQLTDEIKSSSGRRLTRLLQNYLHQ